MATISLSTQLLVVSVITLQRQLEHNKVLRFRKNDDHKVWWNSSYDFIIVGGGTAGSVLAARLTEEREGFNRPFTVLLLEAGGPVHTLTEIIPAFYGDEDTWGYTSVPQKHGGSVKEKKLK